MNFAGHAGNNETLICGSLSGDIARMFLPPISGGEVESLPIDGKSRFISARHPAQDFGLRSGHRLTHLRGACDQQLRFSPNN
jgi:hypothetical protein